MNITKYDQLKQTDFSNGAIRDEIRTALGQREQLKEALQGILFLIDECVSFDDFKNGVEHQGIDEGQVYAGQIIEKARNILMMIRYESRLTDDSNKDRSNRNSENFFY